MGHMRFRKDVGGVRNPSLGSDLGPFLPCAVCWRASPERRRLSEDIPLHSGDVLAHFLMANVLLHLPRSLLDMRFLGRKSCNDRMGQCTACGVLTKHVLGSQACQIDILNAHLPHSVLGKQFMGAEDLRDDAMTPQMPLSELLDCFGEDNKESCEALMQWDRMCSSAPSTPIAQPSFDRCDPAAVASPVASQDDWKAAPFTIKGNYTLVMKIAPSLHALHVATSDTAFLSTAGFPQYISLEGTWLADITSRLYFHRRCTSRPSSQLFPSIPSCMWNVPSKTSPCETFFAAVTNRFGEVAYGIACRKPFQSGKVGSPKSGTSERLSRARANPMKMVGRRTGHSSPYRGVSHHRCACRAHMNPAYKTVVAIFPPFLSPLLP